MIRLSSVKTRYNLLISHATSREADPIDQARVKMLMWGLSACIIFALISVVIYLFTGPVLQLIRAVLCVLIDTILLILVIKKPVWRQVSHAVLALIIAVLWSNVLIYVQGINVPTLQFVFIVIVYAFYAHGTRWGVFYSAMSALPLVLYSVLGSDQYFALPVQAINKPAYIFVVCFNFLLLIFLHYHFFKSFIGNITELSRIGKEEKILNQRLQQAMKDLEKASNAKLDFLSTVSHELRTPLHGVIGLTNILQLQQPREDQKENLEILKFSAQNLMTLINDLLDFNKLEAGKMLTEEASVNLPELLRNICGGPSLRAREKKIEFKLECDESLNDKLIICDPTRLTQVLLNLLNNAVKFTSKGSVELRAKVSETAEKTISIRFSVKDTGIGMLQSEQLVIFDPFIQASSKIGGRYGGTGLGLAIVKRILEIVFHTSIQLKSEAGKGSEFFFDIAFDYLVRQKVVSRFQQTDNESAESCWRNIKILVAEDNPVNVLVLQRLLKMKDIEVLVAVNGREAVKMAEEAVPDLILMDIHMPELNGFEASEAIRRLANTKIAEIPIIALTASVSEEVKAGVAEAGMNDYLSKPFSPDVLYDKINKFLPLSVENRKIETA